MKEKDKTGGQFIPELAEKKKKISEFKGAEEAPQKSEERFRKIFDRSEVACREGERLSRILESAMDAIITIDDQQRITLFNEAAENVFRTPAASIIGQPVKRFLSNRFRELLTDYLRGFEESDETKRYMCAPEGLTALRADGDLFFLFCQHRDELAPCFIFLFHLAPWSATWVRFC